LVTATTTRLLLICIEETKAKGHVRSFKKDTPKAWFSEVKDCATTDDEATAEYDVAKDSPSCSLIWKWK
jgi:hypothetical protein